eukprot:gnl/TRDRNA2_/TRDRNA2_175499_c1_seq13.p1 gnl/TRDRNA2_/TRDRNA2_175499_c1~~gnl/TRDRNA2_/TRDRNA2_175499_c1_seq13.p1  ORF type:complete len:483 (+),score=48.57 gnl/TRDRNA2_/TRDRNA2_175499_c1_seq13:140-1588(+)
MSAIFLLVYCSLACLLAHAQNQTAGSGTAKGGEVPVAREAERGGGFVGRTDRDEDGNREQRESEMEACAICLDNLLEDVDVLACGHRFHSRCTAELSAEFIEHCPLCRALMRPIIVTADLIKTWLHEVYQRSHGQHPLSRALSSSNRTAFCQEEVIQTLLGFLREGDQVAQLRAASCFLCLLEPTNRQIIGVLHDAGVVPEMIRTLCDGNGSQVFGFAALFLANQEIQLSMDNEVLRESMQVLIRKMKQGAPFFDLCEHPGDPDDHPLFDLFQKLADNRQNHQVICEEGGVQTLVALYRSGSTMLKRVLRATSVTDASHQLRSYYRSGSIRRHRVWLILDKLNDNEQISEVMRKQGGRWCHLMYPFSLRFEKNHLMYRCALNVEQTLGILTGATPDLITRISAWIRVSCGRLKQVLQRLFGCSRESAGIEPNLQMEEVRQPQLYMVGSMVSIAGGTGVLIATLMLCSWGRSINKVEQPLLLV